MMSEGLVLFCGVSALDIGVGIHGMAGLLPRDVFGRYALIELHQMESCSTILEYTERGWG